MKLDGKICIITGGASGIGLEIARTFAAAGGKVAFADTWRLRHAIFRGGWFDPATGEA